MGVNEHMNLSEFGEDCIKLWEEDSLEPKLHAYNDGAGVWTIGWGCTNGVYEGMVITKAQAEEMYQRELREFVECVRKRYTVPLTQNQFDALVSFHYNLGTHAGDSLVAAINRGEYDKAPAIMALYNKARQGANGPLVTWPGLVTRRAREIELWSGTYHDARIPLSAPPEQPVPQPVAVEPAPHAVAAATSLKENGKAPVAKTAAKSKSIWAMIGSLLFGVASQATDTVNGLLDHAGDIVSDAQGNITNMQTVFGWLRADWDKMAVAVAVMCILVALYRHLDLKRSVS
jgi:lysozyme